MPTWPAKTNYATGDVLTAAQMQDIGNALNSVGSAQYAAGKNKIINGDFNIWQRGTSFSPTSASTIYSADRWANYNNGTGVVTTSQQTFTAGTAPVAGYEGTYFHRIAFPASLGTTSLYVFEQRIEDVRTFAGQTVTLSFWAKLGASQASPFQSIFARQNFGSGGSTTVDTAFTNQSLTTSWARYSTTITVPSVASKTIGTGSYLSIYFLFNAQASQTIDFWGVQVEAGNTATPFQTATGTLAGELAACQRYYYRITPDGNNRQYGSGMAYSTTQAVITIPFPVTMRTRPTALEQSGTAADYGTVRATTAVDNCTAALTYYSVTTNVQGALTTTSANLVAGNATMLFANNTNAYLGWSAEL